MRKILFIVFSFLSAGYFTLRAQNVQVTSSFGYAYYGAYNTLKEAFDSINTGYHQGDITVEILASHSLGTTSAKLDSSGKPNTNGNGIHESYYTSVLIMPALGAGSVAITGNPAVANPLIDLNGADNVTIDGLNNGWDSLTFSNTTTGSATTIRLLNDACNNTITRVKVLVAFTTSTLTTAGGAVSISTTYAGGSGNDNNTVSYCILSNSNATNTNFAYKLISLIGSTTNNNIQNSGNQIINNYFINFRASGVYVSGGNRDLTISDNHFYHNATMATSAVIFSPVFISNLTAGQGQNFTITGNYIGGSDSLCGGAKPTIALTSYFQTIYLNCDTAVRSYITNNTINNMLLSSNSASNNYGFISVNNGTADVTGNTIGSQTDTSALIVNMYVSSLQNIIVFGVLGASASNNYGTLRYTDNVVGGITLRNLTAAGAYSGGAPVFSAFEVRGSTGQFIIRNNLIGSPNVPNSIKMNTNNGAYGLFRGSYANSLLNEFVGNHIINLTHFNTTSVNGLFTGYNFTGASAWRVDSNIFENITINTNNTNGLSNGNRHLNIIAISSTATVPGSSCIGNTIRNCVSTSTGAVYSQCMAIDIAGSPAGGITVAGNKIHSFYTKSTLKTAVVYGIRLVATTPMTVTNNQISLGNDSLQTPVSNAHAIYGMYRSGTGIANIYHNAVLINGTNVTPDTSSFAFYNATGGTADVRNNVFVNNRGFHTSSTTQGNYAAAYNGTVSAGSIAGLNSNYNLYYAGNIGGTLMLNNGTSSADINVWRADAYMHDLNSVSDNPSFMSDTLLGGSSWSAITPGDPSTGVTIDITGAVRSLYLMGAYDGYNPVPVTLTSFIGSKQNDDVKLIWTTASETNNKGFEIERSLNGSDFERIQFIRGQGNSSTEARYQTIDTNIFSVQRVAYYRLKQVDFDGKVSYSQTIRVSINKQTVSRKASVYPNPFRDVLHISFEAEASETVFAELSDISGKSVWQQHFLQPQKNLMMEHLQPGIYYLRLTGSSDVQVIKLIKE